MVRPAILASAVHCAQNNVDVLQNAFFNSFYRSPVVLDVGAFKQIFAMADADMSLRDDVEKQAMHDSSSDPENYNEKRGSLYDRDAQLRRGSITPHHEGFFSAFTANSFKRNENARVVTEATDSEGRPLEDQPPAEPALAMKLKGRHLQMIAIGGSIGS